MGRSFYTLRPMARSRFLVELVLEHWRPLVLVLAVGLVFANTLGNSLHLDDAYRIADNPELERVRPLLRHFTDPRTSATLPQLAAYRPLLPLSLSLNAALADALGLDRLAAYHLGNLSLHLATCLLVFLLLSELLTGEPGGPAGRRLFGAPDLALAGALLFGVHPISGVPVNYISARDLLMATLLLTAALLVYARMRRRRGDSVVGWGLALGCLALSLTAKLNGVSFPAVVLVYEICIQGASIRARGPWLRGAAFAVPVAAFFLWTERVLGFSNLEVLAETKPPVIYFLTQMELHLGYYLRNFLWPFPMRVDPLIEPAAGFADGWALACLALVAAALALAWRQRRRAPLASFAVLAYAALLAPTSSFRPFHSLAASYRPYPGLPFLCLLAVLGVGWLAERGVRESRAPRVALGALAVLALYLGTASFFMNRIWATEKTLWGHSVQHGAAPLAHLNYGRAVQAEDPALAEHHYREALRLAPSYVYAHINLGLLQMRQGRVGEGLATVRKAVEAAPDLAVSHHWMAEAYRQAGHLPQAREESRRAADLDPRNVEYQYKAAFDLYTAGRLADSLPYLERVREAVPGYQKSLFLEGFALQQLGRWAEAEPLYRRHLEQYPDSAQVWFNLGHGLAAAEGCEAALPMFERCLELQPGHGAAAHWVERCR